MCSGVCIEECPVDAISLVNEIAEINMDECIRCGNCHEVCPQEAVKHDSERIPEEVEANVKKAGDSLSAGLKIAAIGNVIDFPINNSAKIQKELKDISGHEFAYFDYKKFKN